MIDTDIATGKWGDLLPHFGVDSKFLRNKHGPCPVCSGVDRFRFDDKKGRGTWICNQCGSGDGYSLIQKVSGLRFKEALVKVNEIAGSYQPAIRQVRKADNSEKMVQVRKIWTEAQKIKKYDPAWLYLTRRTGIEKIPQTLKFHPALEYREEGHETTYHPAIVAAIARPDGRGIGVHRIYLTEEGFKASVSSPKKFFVAEEMSGAYVPLFQVKEEIGLAEGIETALAASVRFNVPVLSVLMASGMDKWTPPSEVKKLVIFGDNDASFTGQAAAYALAHRLSKKLEVTVLIPEGVGDDWCSVK